MSRGPLYDGTRDLHHAVEHTGLGRSLSEGVATDTQIAGWLMAQWAIHRAIDPYIPPPVTRGEAYSEDLVALGKLVETPRAARAYAEAMTLDQVDGTLYVLLGANLMGGQVLAKRNPRIPRRHITYPDRPAALEVLAWLRPKEANIPAARATFQALIDSADEIWSWKPYLSEGDL